MPTVPVTENGGAHSACAAGGREAKGEIITAELVHVLTISMSRRPGVHTGDGGAGPPPSPSRDLLVAGAGGNDPMLHALRHHSAGHSVPGEQSVFTDANGDAATQRSLCMPWLVSAPDLP